jgi:uncharacterized protein YggT (Ycf19 family)
MGAVNFILNLAGLLLWLNWRSNRFDPLGRRAPATLMGTLRPATPKKMRRWHLPVFIGSLLLLRAVVYWWIGKETNWAGKLDLGPMVLYFSSSAHWDGFFRMTVFSFLSFGLMLGILYVWLLVLSLLAGPLPIHGLVTIPLGRVDGWPRWAKAILPFVATAMIWWLVAWLLIRLDVLTPTPPAGRFQQSVLLGLSSYLLWKIPLGAILVLHLLNSYIYFGKHPIWKYANATAQTLMQPLSKLPLRAGKIDFGPVAALVVIFLAAHFAEAGLYRLYARLPL